MRKGFTIVELATALVVIGIIMAVAVKGKALMDATSHKVEINKVRKLEAAVHIYLTTNKDLPLKEHGTPVPWGDVDMTGFYEMGILNEKELRSKTLTADGRQGHWTPVLCQYYEGALDFFQGGKQTHPFRPKNYCARIVVGVEGTHPNSNMVWANVPPRTQCGIESMLDDENINTGTARRTYQRNFANYTEEEYSDCMVLSEEAQDDKDMGFVLY